MNEASVNMYTPHQKSIRHAQPPLLSWLVRYNKTLATYRPLLLFCTPPPLSAPLLAAALPTSTIPLLGISLPSVPDLLCVPLLSPPLLEAPPPSPPLLDTPPPSTPLLDTPPPSTPLFFTLETNMSTGFGGELCTVTMGTGAGETLGAFFCCFLPGLAEEEMSA